MIPPLWVLVVLAFCAYRATRLVVHDEIAAPFRVALYRWAFDDPGYGTPTSRGAIRAWLFKLFTCAYCFGLWISAGVYAMWDHWHGGRFLIAIGAVAGAQALLSAYDPGDEDEEV